MVAKEFLVTTPFLVTSIWKTIHVRKHLQKSQEFQVREYRIWVKHRNKKRCTEEGRKGSFSCPSQPSLSPGSLVQWYPLPVEEDWGQHSASPETPEAAHLAPGLLLWLSMAPCKFLQKLRGLDYSSTCWFSIQNPPNKEKPRTRWFHSEFYQMF